MPDATGQQLGVQMQQGDSSDWLRAFRIYFGVIAVGNLAWEALQLPLYTIWTTGSMREQMFAVGHCTGGDILIASSALLLALALVGTREWPTQGFARVAGLTLLLGLAYTIFSEWLNVVVRASWAYSEWMPVIHIGFVSIGLSPLLQWIAIPIAALGAIRRTSGAREAENL